MLNNIFSAYKADTALWFERASLRPSFGSWLRMILTMPGYQFMTAYRTTRALKLLPVIGRALGGIAWAQLSRSFTCEIAQSTDLGEGVYLPHPYGIVIGAATIEARVEILQNVTVGVVHRGDGTRPHLKSGCSIGAGAVILGQVTIGAGAKIGANSVVLADVPDGCSAVGSPARVIEPKR